MSFGVETAISARPISVTRVRQRNSQSVTARNVSLGRVRLVIMYAATSEGTLRERAGLIADSAGIPPASKLKKRKIISALKFACSALAGAAVTALISFLL